MRKKIVKILESALPFLYDEEGEPIQKKKVANRILDAIPSPERLDLEPFQTWVPFICSTCNYNQGRDKGCIYDLMSESKHQENPAPLDCPLGY